MSTWITILVSAIWLLGCSAEGEGPIAIPVAFKEELPEQQDSAVSLTLSYDEFSTSEEMLQSCQRTLDLPSIVQPQDRFDWISEDEKVFSIESTSQGLLIGFDEELGVLELSFSKVVLDTNESLEIRDLFELKIEGDQVWIGKQGRWQSLEDPSLVRSYTDGQKQMIEISEFISAAAQQSAMWSIKAQSFSRDQWKILGSWYFQGRQGLEQSSIRAKICSLSVSGSSIWWLEATDSKSFEELPTQYERVSQLIRAASIDAYEFLELNQLPNLWLSVFWQKSLQPGSRRLSLNQSDAQIPDGNQVEVYHQALILSLKSIFEQQAGFKWQASVSSLLAYTLAEQLILEKYGHHVRSQIWLAEKANSIQELREFSRLLAFNRSKEELLGVWQSCLSQEQSLETCFFQGLFDDLSELAGWFNNEGTYHFDFDPKLLDDLDGDGLDVLFENHYGLSDESWDSDQDSWSDLAELSLKRSPKNPVSHPVGLVFDGYFEDWLRLIPQAIQVNEDSKQGACDQVGLKYFSALDFEDHLIVGARLQPALGNIRWSVEIGKASSAWRAESVSASAVWSFQSDQLEKLLSFQRSYQQHPSDLELFLPKALFQNQEDIAFEVRILVYEKIKNGWRFCGDTPWFKPQVSSN